MILFDKDFQEQGAIVDYSTSNLSFVRYSAILRKMGIKNHLWPLALYQADLQNVNPHDTNLHPDLKLKIAVECKINPWYFFREVARVPMSGSDAGPYVANRANMALMWLFMNCIHTFLTIPRQIGKTVATMTLVAWLMYIAGRSMNIGLFAKGTKLVLENVSRLKIIRDALPTYLVKKSSDDTNNKEGLDYKALNNKYLTFVAQSDKKAAEDQGRGESFSIEHWDEMAYYTNNELSYQSALSAADTAGDQVREAGIPAANIITTTAGDIDDPRGAYAFSIKSDALNFTERLFDCKDQTELKSIISSNSNNSMVYLEFSYKQLGKDEAWFQEKTRGKSQDKINKDYLNIWGRGKETGVIPDHIIRKMLSCVREPSYCQMYETLMLKWYVDETTVNDKLFRNKPLLIGSDTSDNIGLDFTTIVIIDPSDMTVVCTCRCNISNLVHVGDCIAKLLLDFPRSIFIPERNKNGAVLIDMIMVALANKVQNPFSRIYNTVYQNTPREDINTVKLDISDGPIKKSFGFTTTSSATSRDLLYKSVLMTAVDRNWDKIFDSNLIDEIKGLEVKNGRIDHSNHGHDDLLIAYLLCCYFVFYGKNIDMYGIMDGEFLSHVNTKGEHIDPVLRNEQTSISKSIRDIESALSNPSLNSIMRRTYENKLKDLKSFYKPDLVQEEFISVEQVRKKQSEEMPHHFLISENTPQQILFKLF